MKQRVLITGATGTVGGSTIRQIQSGADRSTFEVIGAARNDKSASKLEAAGITPVLFDYDRPETLRPALKGVNAIFLVTGYTVDMLVHSKRLLDAAKAEGVRHIVHLGAMAADDTPHAHFAWHQMIERAIEAMGFEWTHLRPNFFMDTIWAGFRHRPDRLVHFVGDHSVSFVSADDIGAVAAAALRDPDTHKSKTYPLAVEAMPFAEVANILAEVTGRSVEYRPRPASSLFETMIRQGAEPIYAKSLAEGIAAIEDGKLPLADAIYDAVETVTGRKGIGWKEYAEARLKQLPAADA